MVGWFAVFLMLMTVPAWASVYVYVPPSPPNTFVACGSGAGWCAAAEDAEYDSGGPWAIVANTEANGGDYLAMPLGSADYQSQIAVRINFACNPCYLWIRARTPSGGRSLVWVDTAPFPSTPSNTKASFLFGGQTQSSFAFSAIGSRTDENITRAIGTNDTAQRSFSLADGSILYVLAQPDVHLDSLFLSTNSSTPPVSPDDTPSPTTNYTFYEQGAESTPTVDGAVWQQAAVVTQTGYSSPPAADMEIRAIYKDSTDRMYVRCEETLANLEWSTTTEDNTAIGSDTACTIQFKLADTNRALDANTWRVIGNPQPISMTATWPSGVFSTTADLANLAVTTSLSGNRRRIQLAFDTPSAIAAGQIFLCDFTQREKMTGSSLKFRYAFNSQSAENTIAEWGTCLFGGTIPPSPEDTTPPSVGAASVANVTATSLTVSATASDAESGISLCEALYDTDNDGAVSGADLGVVIGGTPVGGTCTVTVTGLSPGVAYEVAVRATNGNNLTAVGAVVDQTTTSSAERFVCATGGNNGNSGTSAGQCWGDLAYALAKARFGPPGDADCGGSCYQTLTLVSGTYAGSNNFPVLNCTSGGNANNGTASSPLTVRAQSERQAWIKRAGDGFNWQAAQCSFWTIQGLRFSSADNNSFQTPQAMFSWNGGSNLTLRRNLFHTDNRCNNYLMLSLLNITDSLVEENEVLNFYRNAFGSKYTNRVEFRRNYLNSRNRADPTTAVCNPVRPSGTPQAGDEGISIYPGQNAKIADNITENIGAGVVLNAAGTTIGNQIFSHVSISDYTAVRATARGNTLDTMPRDTTARNILGLLCRSHCVYLRAAKNSVVEQFFLLTGSNGGFVADSANATFVGDGASSATVRNGTSLSHAGTGFWMLGAASGTTFTWTADSITSFGNGTNFSPAATDARITNEGTTNPSLPAGVRLWVPSTVTALYLNGFQDGSRGPEILFVTENGVLTTTKLWNSSTGAFNFCGATVNDADLNTTTNGCADVHSRIGNTVWPGGY